MLIATGRGERNREASRRSLRELRVKVSVAAAAAAAAALARLAPVAARGEISPGRDVPGSVCKVVTGRGEFGAGVSSWKDGVGDGAGNRTTAGCGSTGATATPGRSSASRASSNSGRGCGWTVAAPNVTGACARGALLVARMTTPPSVETPAPRRSVTMYPATDRSRMSRAWRSGRSVSSSVTGPPPTRSPLTMRVPPRRPHSVRIVLIGAFCAFSVTRPLLN